MKLTREIAAVDRAAGIAGIDPFDPLPCEIHADLEIGDDFRAARLGDGERVADMVIVAVREQDMRGVAGRPGRNRV